MRRLRLLFIIALVIFIGNASFAQNETYFSFGFSVGPSDEGLGLFSGGGIFDSNGHPVSRLAEGNVLMWFSPHIKLHQVVPFFKDLQFLKDNDEITVELFKSNLDNNVRLGADTYGLHVTGEIPGIPFSLSKKTTGLSCREIDRPNKWVQSCRDVPDYRDTRKVVDGLIQTISCTEVVGRVKCELHVESRPRPGKVLIKTILTDRMIAVKGMYHTVRTYNKFRAAIENQKGDLSLVKTLDNLDLGKRNFAEVWANLTNARKKTIFVEGRLRDAVLEGDVRLK